MSRAKSDPPIQPAKKKRRGRPPARDSEAMREEYGEARVIRRYGNRRLYDATQSRCVTLEEIADFVKHGEDVRVIDSDSNEDITRRILTQIILEEPNQKRLDMLPIDLLRKMISMRDDALAGWLEQYLSAGAEWLGRQMSSAHSTAIPKGMQESMESFFPWLKPGATFNDGPKPSRKAPPAPRQGGSKTPANSEVRDEIEELQRRLSELASKIKRK